MLQLKVVPQIYSFDSFEKFAEDFKPNEEDLVLTNRYIYEPNFIEKGIRTQVIYKNDFGKGEPTDSMVTAMLKSVDLSGCRRIIAIGGGSIVDIAKVLAVAEDPNIDALYEKAPNLPKKRQLIIIPTTCGTGSEVTNISVLNRERLGTKMGLVGEGLYADAAVLIPTLMHGLPFRAFATSSIDALVHAVESALSPNATVYTRLFSYSAIDLIVKGYQALVSNNMEGLDALLPDFLIASNYAGIAFSIAGCGTIHAMAYPLGGKYHVAHGESNYALFAGVLRKYKRMNDSGELAALAGHLAAILHTDAASAYDTLAGLVDHILPGKPLSQYGVTEADVPVFAESVMRSQGRLLKNSFVPMRYQDIYDIYQELLN